MTRARDATANPTCACRTEAAPTAWFAPRPTACNSAWSKKPQTCCKSPAWCDSFSCGLLPRNPKPQTTAALGSAAQAWVSIGKKTKAPTGRNSRHWRIHRGRVVPPLTGLSSFRIVEPRIRTGHLQTGDRRAIICFRTRSGCADAQNQNGYRSSSTRDLLHRGVGIMRAAIVGRLLVGLSVTLGLAHARAHAADKSAPDKNPTVKTLTVQDVFNLQLATDPQISPDGRRIVYVRRFSDIMTDQRHSNLWIINADGTDHRPLSTGNFNDASP